MPKGIMRPPSSLPTRSEHMANTYPEAMAGGGGKKPPVNKMTMTGGPSPDDGNDARNARDAFANSQPPVTGLIKRNDNFSSGAGSARLNETSDLRLSGYPLGFSGWFDHAEQQEEKSRRAYEEYTKFNKGK
jgi:hypothetical protein